VLSVTRAFLPLWVCIGPFVSKEMKQSVHCAADTLPAFCALRAGSDPDTEGGGGQEHNCCGRQAQAYIAPFAGQTAG